MYLPKIKEENIKKLYFLRERLNKNGKVCSMTSLVNDAINQLISQYGKTKGTKIEDGTAK